MVLKEFICVIVCQCKCHISRKNTFAFKGRCKSGQCIKSSFQEKKYLMSFNVIQSTLKGEPVAELLNSVVFFFLIRSSQCIVKILIYLHCIKPKNTIPELQLNSKQCIKYAKTAMQQWWLNKPLLSQLGNTVISLIHSFYF